MPKATQAERELRLSRTAEGPFDQAEQVLIHRVLCLTRASVWEGRVCRMRPLLPLATQSRERDRMQTYNMLTSNTEASPK